MTEDLRRDKVLVKCPHAVCARGDKTCQKRSVYGHCSKTHFSSLDEWIKSIACWMARIRRDILANPNMEDEDFEAYQGLYAALAERIEDGINLHYLSNDCSVR